MNHVYRYSYRFSLGLAIAFQVVEDYERDTCNFWDSIGYKK